MTKTLVILDGDDRFRLNGLRDGFLLRADPVGATFTRLAPLSSPWSQRTRRELDRAARLRRAQALLDARN